MLFCAPEPAELGIDAALSVAASPPPPHPDPFSSAVLDTDTLFTALHSSQPSAEFTCFPASGDLFSPRVVRVLDGETRVGQCPHCVVPPAQADDEQALSDHLSRKHGVSPLFRTRYAPPVRIQTSRVDSVLGEIDEGLCGACGTWVVGAVTWTRPGDYVPGWVPNWSRWYGHARNCHADAFGRTVLPPAPPAACSTSPSGCLSCCSSHPSTANTYASLFPPPFADPPTLTTHLPPPLFAPAAFPDPTGIWRVQLHTHDLAGEAPEPTPSPLVVAAPAIVLRQPGNGNGNDCDSESDKSTYSPLVVRVRAWTASSIASGGVAPPRLLSTAALAAQWGSAGAVADEADKENAVPAGGTPGRTLRPRKRKAENEQGEKDLRSAKRAR